MLSIPILDSQRMRDLRISPSLLTRFHVGELMATDSPVFEGHAGDVESKADGLSRAGYIKVREHYRWRR